MIFLIYSVQEKKIIFIEAKSLWEEILENNKRLFALVRAFMAYKNVLGPKRKAKAFIFSKNNRKMFIMLK